MNRTLPLALAACLAVAGCSRNADPMDWKIEARDTGELQGWLDDNLPLMPHDLSAELSACLLNIRANTTLGPTGTPRQRNNLFCRQVDGHTVRAVLIEGHEHANRMLLGRIANESNAVVRLLATADQLNPDELKKHEALMNSHLAARDALEQRLRLSESRVVSLRALPKSE